MVRILVSFWDGPFSRAFAVSFREGTDLYTVLEKNCVKETFSVLVGGPQQENLSNLNFQYTRF